MVHSSCLDLGVEHIHYVLHSFVGVSHKETFPCNKIRTKFKQQNKINIIMSDMN